MVDTITPDPTVQAAVNGDREAFGKLWDQHWRSVYRYILKRVMDRDLAEDLTSDTCYLALRAIHQFRTDGPPILAWLYTIARNRIGGHWGQVRRRPMSDRPLTDRAGVENPEWEVITRDAALGVLRCIGGLRDNYRRVLLYRFLDGLDQHETAEAMGAGYVAVRNWQVLAVRQCRVELDPVRYLPREVERANGRRNRRSPKEAARRAEANTENVPA
jgi:RNA polymerase sigma-70 factor (ECF subfamily)